MSAVLSKALADLRRRRTQTAAVVLATLLAAASATLVLNLLAETARGTRPAVAVTLLAVGVLAVAGSAAVVVDLVGGIVLAASREAGVMRAIGCTPGQVVAGFVIRMLAPAAAGCAVGAAGGVLLSRLLGSGVRRPLLDVAAAVGILALVALAAALPAIWTTRIPVVRALRSD